jgi:hypothetical protein
MEKMKMAKDTQRIDAGLAIAQAIGNSFQYGHGIDGNAVDALYAIADSLDRVADAINAMKKDSIDVGMPQPDPDAEGHL